MSSLSINNGAGSTSTQTVTLNHNRSGGAPTEYIASESSSFAGANWQTYTTTPGFTVSASAGTKTIYLKLRNADGESGSQSDTITYSPPNPPILSSLSINNGGGSTSTQTVTLNHNRSGGTPTEYIASESPSFAGANWQTYTATPAFTVSASAGIKTIYLKLRNADGESSPQNDTITYSPANPPILSSLNINNGATSTTAQVVTLNHSRSGGTPTDYIASESSSFSGASWQPYSTTPSFMLSSGAGTKTVYLKLRNADGESGLQSDAITYSPVLYTVTPSAGPNGSIIPNIPQPVSSGGSVTFTATPNAGYTVDQWFLNGAPTQPRGRELHAPQRRCECERECYIQNCGRTWDAGCAGRPYHWLIRECDRNTAGWEDDHRG